MIAEAGSTNGSSITSLLPPMVYSRRHGHTEEPTGRKGRGRTEMEKGRHGRTDTEKGRHGDTGMFSEKLVSLQFRASTSPCLPFSSSPCPPRLPPSPLLPFTVSALSRLRVSHSPRPFFRVATRPLHPVPRYTYATEAACEL